MVLAARDANYCHLIEKITIKVIIVSLFRALTVSDLI